MKYEERLTSSDCGLYKGKFRGDELGKRKELQARVFAYEETGLSPEEIKELQAKDIRLEKESESKENAYNNAYDDYKYWKRLCNEQEDKNKRLTKQFENSIQLPYLFCISKDCDIYQIAYMRNGIMVLSDTMNYKNAEANMKSLSTKEEI